MAKKGKVTTIPYGKHTFKKRKTRAGGSLMRVGGRRRRVQPRVKDKTFPVIVTQINTNNLGG